MTTIVYNHKSKQVACDGLILTSGCIMAEDYQKWREKGGAVYFFAGVVADISEFLARAGDYGNKPKITPEVSCLKVCSGGVYECGFDDESGYWELKVEYSFAIGSGSQFALAALDFGKSAKEAVEYAMTRDSGTGGKVSVFDCQAMGFIDD